MHIMYHTHVLLKFFRDFQTKCCYSLMNSFTFNRSFRIYRKCLFILMVIIGGCLLLNFKKILPSNLVQKQTRPNAFIISADCSSARFNFTKQNIERVFPDFFIIHCIRPIPLNDSRIDQSATLLNKKLASNLITFITVWTYEIPKYSTNDDLEWSFVFEDDVDFLPPANFSLPNYISVVQELMHNPEVQLKDGAFHLGICGPTFSANASTLTMSVSNNKLLSKRLYGTCAHAMGLTTRRARSFWADVSFYHSTTIVAADIYIVKYCHKSGNHLYTLGANMEWPPNTKHYGIAYQDRQRFRSGVW